jgi:hypothetical protein
MDATWEPPSEWERALRRDIMARLQQHSREDTLPRSPRGLFYDLRPSGLGNGLTYIKQPRMTVVGHTSAGKAINRRADPFEISPVQVQECLARMRRALQVPEQWIEDTRAPNPDVPYYSNDTAEERADSLLNQINDAYIAFSPQNGQPVFLEVLAEAGGLVGRLARVARPFGVPVYSGGGFDGLKGKRAFAQRAADRDVPTVVLRVSDFDWHGLMMSESTAADCVAWAVNYHGSDPDDLTFERIALTEEQAEDADLLDEAGKAEVEGLPVPVMDAILTAAIESYQDAGIRQANRERGAAESARVTGLVLAGLNGGDDE